MPFDIILQPYSTTWSLFLQHIHNAFHIVLYNSIWNVDVSISISRLVHDERIGKRLMHWIFSKSKMIILYVSFYDLDTCRFAVKLQTIWYGKRKMLKLLLRATKKETQTIPTYLRRAIIRKPHVIKGNIMCMHFLLHFSYLNFIAS